MQSGLAATQRYANQTKELFPNKKDKAQKILEWYHPHVHIWNAFIQTVKKKLAAIVDLKVPCPAALQGDGRLLDPGNALKKVTEYIYGWKAKYYKGARSAQLPDERAEVLRPGYGSRGDRDTAQALLPGIGDGMAGMGFIAACVASSRADAAWTRL